MIHHHFSSMDSTQDYLRNNWHTFSGSQILISTAHQTAGKGRRGNPWIQPENSLAFSCSLAPNPVPTLSSLEIACQLVNFFLVQHGIKLFVKWPNDLFTQQRKKCGGILIHFSPDGQFLLVGVGINYGPFRPPLSLKNLADFCVSESNLTVHDYQAIPALIYRHLLENRLTPTEVISQWNKSCLHLGAMVSIGDDTNLATGIFLGIDKNGQAILKIDRQRRTFLTGHLNML